MQDILKRLQNVTSGCRGDMHEPDNQDVFAKVEGMHLDNAFGEDGGWRGEFVITITKGDEQERFNLATLIALARKAEL